MWCDAQSSLYQGPSDKNFDERGELREANEHNIYAFDFDSYVDMDNLIGTCVEFHNDTPNENVHSYD